MAALVAQPPALATASKAQPDKENPTLNTDPRAAARDFDRYPFAAAAAAMRGTHRETFIRLAGLNWPDLLNRARAAIELHLAREAEARQ